MCLCCTFWMVLYQNNIYTIFKVIYNRALQLHWRLHWTIYLLIWHLYSLKNNFKFYWPKFKFLHKWLLWLKQQMYFMSPTFSIKMIGHGHCSSISELVYSCVLHFPLKMMGQLLQLRSGPLRVWSKVILAQLSLSSRVWKIQIPSVRA